MTKQLSAGMADASETPGWFWFAKYNNKAALCSGNVRTSPHRHLATGCCGMLPGTVSHHCHCSHQHRGLTRAPPACSDPTARLHYTRLPEASGERQGQSPPCALLGPDMVWPAHHYSLFLYICSPLTLCSVHIIWIVPRLHVELQVSGSGVVEMPGCPGKGLCGSRGAGGEVCASFAPN